MYILSFSKVNVQSNYLIMQWLHHRCFVYILQTLSELLNIINCKHKYFLVEKETFFLCLRFAFVKCPFSENIVFSQFAQNFCMCENILVRRRKDVVLGLNVFQQKSNHFLYVMQIQQFPSFKATRLFCFILSDAFNFFNLFTFLARFSPSAKVFNW